MRGNRRVEAFSGLNHGSIPARAGEPRRPLGQTGSPRVYPRACGGTEVKGEGDDARAGLSPRVRGNRTDRSSRWIRWRSIPARAGEPGSDDWICASVRVYPRACGGTAVVEHTTPPGWGLSPRVRGNHVLGCDGVSRHRSIPARAGEPTIAAGLSSLPRVYPRACGGTGTPGFKRSLKSGLSPRVRGNRRSSSPT